MADPQKKPNILFIMADDIGWFEFQLLQPRNHGLRDTTRISTVSPRKARCSPILRAAGVVPQAAPPLLLASPPSAPVSPRSVHPAPPSVSASMTLPSGNFMKNFGYATGQFGKNHLGDRNEHLPTVQGGFDEFFGNLYHLNAEEEPYYPNYPKDPAFRKKYGPRGVLECKATDKDDATVDEQFGKVGKQTIENTGPLPKERMETVDEEFLVLGPRFH